RVLHGMSLHIGAGEFVTLLGRNGMGKSTTVKCIVGLLRTQSGSRHFDGQDTTRHASHQIARAGIGLVPEGRQIFPNLSVEENLLATARMPGRGFRWSAPTSWGQRRTAHDRGPEFGSGLCAPAWTLDRVYALFPRLQERRANPGTRLSGGEQQM